MKYILPLTLRFSKVMDVNHNMAFDFPIKWLSSLFPNYYELTRDEQTLIVDTINGEETGIKYSDLIYNDRDTVIYKGEQPFIIVRGWGYLTGCGGLNLTEDEAVAAQTEFANFIISRLS